jgi:RNA polymerase sigma-70 factor, ECF subfamily
VDREEFNGFYAASFPRLVGQLYAMTGDRAEAQDAVQEAFVRAWVHRGQIGAGRGGEAWVRADLGGQRGARCRPGPRAQATSDPRFSGWYGGRPRRSLICCWMTSGAGRASTV